MSDAEELENQGFKVKDRRRFHPDGRPVEGAEEAAPAEAAKTDPAEAAPKPSEPREAPRQAESSDERMREIPADLSSLILSLAAGAHSGLGLAPHPMSGKVEKNLVQAKYNIDLLAILEAKTQGNLTPEEAQLLQAILYDLRMRFVEAQSSS